MEFLILGDFQREDHLDSCVGVNVLIFEHPLGLKLSCVDVILKMLLLVLSDPLLIAIFTFTLSNYSAYG